MCLVTTAAIRETSGGTIYQELGFKSIKTHIGKEKNIDYTRLQQWIPNFSKFIQILVTNQLYSSRNHAWTSNIVSKVASSSQQQLNGTSPN